MTQAARISQADMARAVKAARSVAPDARIRFDLRNQWIDIILGEAPANDAAKVWSDDDV